MDQELLLIQVPHIRLQLVLQEQEQHRQMEHQVVQVVIP